MNGALAGRGSRTRWLVPESHLGEILTDDDGPRIVARGGLTQLVGDGAGHEVGDDELLGLGLARHAAKLIGLRVVGGEAADLVFERRPSAVRRPRRLRHLAALVDEAVHAIARADE